MDDMVHVHETIPTVETKATEPFQPESLRDTVNEELDCLFGIFQGAADDLEQALDRIEEEEVWEIAEAAGDAKIAVYSATCDIERRLSVLRDAVNEHEEASAPA